MTIAQLRTAITTGPWTRNATDPTAYPLAMVDAAAMFVGNDLLRRTMASKTVNSTVLIAGIGVTTPSTASAAPANLAATAISPTQINLTWTNNTADESGITIQRATNATFTQNVATFTAAATATSYSDTGLSADQTYYYQVVATDPATQPPTSQAINTVDLSLGGAIGFRPELILEAVITGSKQLTSTPKVVPYLEIFQRINRYTSIKQSIPELLAFQGPTPTATLYPSPDTSQTYTLAWLWYQPLAGWTPGDTGAGANVFGSANWAIPDDYIGPILMGIGALVQHSNPEQAFASESWQRYDKFVNEVRGLIGGRGAKSVERGRVQRGYVRAGNGTFWGLVPGD